ncbi:hypothetical protein [Streptomyces sp. MST-110588]|uniref:hypothetical protein n=1 Tax=Streptomyces sp. MST-110588 TaxID=2833628 RepID=UPI001F5C38E6|nr:hypothetical protein [Streptomyces sp. MST-110588]UNO43520.1 hypothetical protein KGS77_33660 [Streptomyces sp. MST-110588]
MSVWSTLRGRRPTGPAAAVLAVVLVGVLHVLGCAHGPQSGAGARTDAFAGASWTASSDGPESFDRASGPAPSHGGVSPECDVVDPPGLSGGRAAVAAPACVGVAAVPVMVPPPGRWAAGAARQPRAGPLGERLRAALGVWRA